MEDAVLARQAAEQLNEKLRASEQRFRAIVDALPAAVYATDGKGRVTHFNAAAAELSGRTPELGTSEWPASWKLHGAGGTRLMQDESPMVRALADGREVAGEQIVIERPDGSRVTVIVNIRPLKDERGAVVGAVNCFYDITERMRVEEELRESAVKLSDADRRKSEFLAMLAHELRNPLAPISHGLHILRASGEDSQTVKAVTDLMERQVDQLVGLVNDLLDVNRISRGRIELHPVRIDLKSIVMDAVEATRPLAERMEHDLAVTMPQEPIFLSADPLRLSQVLGNLLNNACKFSKGGGRIGLSVEREGDDVVIRVRDNGIGIAADQLPLIFDLFMQADVSIERSVGGLGIGLALVKALVELHGGTVAAHSPGVGLGSEFVVRLPITMETPRPQPAVPQARATATAHRILVVDDNRDAANSLAMLLKLSGNEGHVAYDGIEAVEAAARVRPDLILMDIGLPRMNGYEAARRIREQPWGESVVLVALTGWGQDEDRRKSKDSGFDGHLVKPVDLEALTALLAKFRSVGSTA
jgi:PAS domain S-box-containing protein